jgi:RNA polymerase sigma-70 factor (family 1)
LPEKEIYIEPHLLQSIAKGDVSAFERLVRAYQLRLFSYIYKAVQSRELTLDLIQDIFLTLWLRREKLPEIRQFNAYIYQVAHNIVYQSLKQIAREALVLKALRTNNNCLADTNAAGDSLLSKEVREYIQSLVDAMPARQREAFLLSREEQLGYDAIAERMNIGRETVKYHVAEALKFLRSELTKQYGKDALVIIMIWQLRNL